MKDNEYCKAQYRIHISEDLIDKKDGWYCRWCGLRVKEHDLFDAKEGARLKEEGIQKAQDAADIEEWKDSFKETLLDFAIQGAPFTSEDIIKEIGLPRGRIRLHGNNAVGALMNAAAKREIIIKTGIHVPSQRPVSHGAELTQWVGTGLKDDWE